MTFQRTPWAIGGGATIEPEVMRLLAYASTDKTEGIVDIGDLRVRALSVAGPSVIIGAGGAIIKNRSAGGEAQSYLVRNDGDQQVDNIPAVGGSPRSDMVIVRIVDPQYSPWPPLASGQDPSTALYVEPFIVTNVPSTAKSVMDLNGGAGLGYSAIAVARIDRPASATAVTDAQIVPLRRMASPRRQRSLNVVGPADGNVNDATGTSGKTWPSEAAWSVEVPEWAARARVRADWGQVVVPAGSVIGYLWAAVGSVATENSYYDTPGATSAGRSTFMAGGDIAIPAALRGTTQTVQMRSRVTSGPTASRIYMDHASIAILDIEFLEAPAEDA